MIRKSSEVKKLLEEHGGFIVKNYPLVSLICDNGRKYQVARNTFDALHRSGFVKAKIIEQANGYRFLAYAPK